MLVGSWHRCATRLCAQLACEVRYRLRIIKRQRRLYKYSLEDQDVIAILVAPPALAFLQNIISGDLLRRSGHY